MPGPLRAAGRRPSWEGAARRCLLIALVSALVALALAGTARAADPCAPLVNPVACENSKPGDPQSSWDVSGAGSSTIQGFATDISVNHGQTIAFKVKTPAKSYRLDIYRMGYYGGAGARKVATVTPSAALPQTQPSCKTTSATGLIDCGNWAVSASWAVPADAVSGVYFARLVRTDGTTGASHVVFVVRADESHSDLLFETSDTTWQAYNDWGGNSLYTGSPAGRAYKVSYNRPFNTRGDSAEDFVFNAEYPAIRFLEANGYDVSYFTGVDGDRNGGLIRNHRTFLSVGHDEYWSGGQRANVEAARDAGVNLAFMSGNEVFWKTRWEASSASGTSQTYRTLVCYKETHANAVIDPFDPPTWTGSWRDPRFSPPGDGGRPENGLSGTIFMVNGGTSRKDSITVPSSFKALRFWRGTSVAGLAAGASKRMPAGTLGYEWDAELDNGARPAGLIDLSRTTLDVSPDYLLDYGSSFGNGIATHSLTLYRAASRALVFGAGTVQWSWGLDATHDFSGTPTDRDIQQATVNVLADMGAQPATLASGLAAASASTDTTGPTTSFTSPPSGATVSSGQTVTVTGTASDAGAGVVAGVEVSTDGGTTWHPAAGTTSWSSSWTPGAGGSVTLKARATDDSANLGATASTTVTVAGRSCPCSLWSDAAKPVVATDPDASAVELGLKFRSDNDGFVSGVRFYKGSTNTGTHVGRLWTAGGQLLASATFQNETASGWQRVSFANPVAVTANTTYVVSYTAPNGHYAEDDNVFTTAGLDAPPLHALRSGVSGPNGAYAAPGSFPVNDYQQANYWVDVVFDQSASDTTAPTVTSRTPAAGATGVATGTNVTATFSEPVQSGTASLSLTGPSGAVAGTTSSGTTPLTFTPSSALAASTTYTVTVSGAKDAAGNTMSADTWTFTTAAADTTPPTVTARTPAAGATGVATTTSVTATFSEPVSGPALTLTGPAGVVAGTLTYDQASRTATLKPASPLAAATAYTATVSGAKDAAGNTMATDSWTFTTAAGSGTTCPCTIFGTSTPKVAADGDIASVEIGVKFRSDVAGSVTGIRFYKATANTGTHTGSLWTATGTKLAGGTFGNETASGWQTLTFSAPVPIQANTTYVASYHAPNGRYAADEQAFATAGVDNAPLHALRNGLDGADGVYAYGSLTTFPTSTYASTNYWVDVVFTTP